MVPNWIRILSAEDLQFVKRLVLSGGSLKAVAKEYGVSYPTLRKRLDRLVRKVRAADDPTYGDALEQLVGLLVSDGILAAGTGRTLVQAHYQSVREMAPEPPPPEV